jgi:hypothetical protein
MTMFEHRLNKQVAFWCRTVSRRHTVCWNLFVINVHRFCQALDQRDERPLIPYLIICATFAHIQVCVFIFNNNLIFKFLEGYLADMRSRVGNGDQRKAQPNNDTELATKRNNLEELYRPPMDIIARGDFEKVCHSFIICMMSMLLICR